MDVETLAEVICNLNDMDPNDPSDWETGLDLARQDMEAVAAGEAEAWWEED